MCIICRNEINDKMFELITESEPETESRPKTETESEEEPEYNTRYERYVARLEADRIKREEYIARRTFTIEDCKDLIVLPTLPKGVKRIKLLRCYNLRTITSLPEGLEELKCVDCISLTAFPEFPSTLKRLFCNGCAMITSIPSLPESMEHFECRRCVSLTSLPDWECCTLISLCPMLDNDENAKRHERIRELINGLYVLNDKRNNNWTLMYQELENLKTSFENIKTATFQIANSIKLAIGHLYKYSLLTIKDYYNDNAEEVRTVQTEINKICLEPLMKYAEYSFKIRNNLKSNILNPDLDSNLLYEKEYFDIVMKSNLQLSGYKIGC